MSFVVGQFNDSYPPIMDGVANTVKNYAYWIDRKYGKSCVITPQYPNYIDNDNFPVLRYKSFKLITRPPYRYGVPYVDSNFIKRVNKIPFDLVHAHCPFTTGKLAYKIAKKKNIPIVATFHSQFYKDFKEVFGLEIVVQSILKNIIDYFNKVDYVWTVNKNTAETFRSYGYKGNIDIIYNGTDFDISDIDIEKNRVFINKKHNINEHDLVFLFVGQHIWQKNLKMLVEALSIVQKHKINYKMFFVGTGYAENKLKTMVKDLGLAEKVVFVGSVKERDLLQKYYSRADLFLFPSIYDNGPIVVKEASALNCPSLLIKNSNASEGVRDGYNGFLSANDTIAYANKIMQIIDDIKLMKKVGKNASTTISKSWESVVDEVYLRYKDIIKSSKRKVF